MRITSQISSMTISPRSLSKNQKKNPSNQKDRAENLCWMTSPAKRKTMRKMTRKKWFQRNPSKKSSNQATMIVRKFIPNYPVFAKTILSSKLSLNLIRPIREFTCPVIFLYHPISSRDFSIIKSLVSNGYTICGTPARAVSLVTTWDWERLSKSPPISRASLMPK